MLNSMIYFYQPGHFGSPLWPSIHGISTPRVPCLQDEWKIRLPNKHRPTAPCLPTQELNISFTRFGPFGIIETRTREDTHDLCELHHTWYRQGSGVGVWRGRFKKWWDLYQFPSTLRIISVTLWWRSDVIHSREGSDRSHVATFAKILPARVIFFGSPAYQQLTKTCWLLRPCICQAPHHSPNPKNWLYKGLVIGTRSKKMQHEQVPLVSDDMQCFTSSKGFSLTCRREQTSRLDSEVDHRN